MSSEEVMEMAYTGLKESSEEREDTKEVYYPRRNGWNCPWHPLQPLAWAVVIFFAIFYFGFLVFYIPGGWRSIGYIVSITLILDTIAH